MKYFVRILAFLFISFSFGFCKGLHPIKELLYYTNEITSYSDISSLGVNTDKKNISNVGTIFIPLSYFKYFFKSPIDGRLFYLYVRDYESKLDHIFYKLNSTSTSISFYYFKNPVMKFEYRNWEDIAFTYVDSLEKFCEITLFGKGTFNGFFCVLKGYDVPCLNPDYYFSEKLGKCIPACPEGAYYNSFSEECTSTCDNVSNREERFDCLCKERGFGGYKSSMLSRKFVITNTPNGATSDVLYTGSIYCSIGELNPGDVSDYLKNKGYDDKDLEQATSDFFEINDVIDKNNFSDSGSSSGSSGGSVGEQDSTEPLSPEQQKQEQDRNECKAIVSAITADFRAYTQKYVNNGIDCSDDRAVQLARDAKSTIEMKVQTYNQSKCATAYHKIDFNVPIYSCKTDPTKPDPIEPPAPQNPSESIKYDENTNTLTTTDSTGNTQAVTPSNVTKDDKGELESIKYTDPETGKTIEYKTKEDGTWERIEYPGQGTNPNENDSGTGQGEGKPGGSSDGEGAGTSEDGEGKFVGGEFGALGNANDFDEGGEALSAFEDLDKKSSGLIDSAESLYQDSLSALTDFKSSIDNLKEKANELRDNPFSASAVSSCPLSFTLLDQTIDIDVCKHTSQFRNLVYFLIYIPLNVFIAFKLLSLLFLIIVNI